MEHGSAYIRNPQWFRATFATHSGLARAPIIESAGEPEFPIGPMPTIGAKNRELIMARPDLCVAIHLATRGSTRTRDCVRQALQAGIPSYLIENEWAIPIRLKTRDSRLG
jgi:hypothetical protein